MDLGLPRMNGWEALLRMREKDPGVRCLIASGNIDAPRRQELTRLGAGSIRKPYTAGQLLGALQTILTEPGA